MNRETQVGLALAILLIGIVGAAFLRKPTLNAEQGTPKTNSTPIKDSRSESERPPRSLNSPRRANTDSVTETPRVTSNTPPADTSPAPQSTTTNIPTPTPPKPTPTDSPEPQPKSDSSPTTPPAPQSVRVALGQREPPAPPLPSTRPPSTRPPSTRPPSTRPPTTTPTRPKPPRTESPRPRIAPDPREDRQPGTPAQSGDRDIDRAPSGLRFLPARHPLAGRRARRPNRSDKR
jgi:hypothetical protein